MQEQLVGASVKDGRVQGVPEHELEEAGFGGCIICQKSCSYALGLHPVEGLKASLLACAQNPGRLVLTREAGKCGHWASLVLAATDGVPILLADAA